jgi:hypothetical protein
MVAEGGVHSYEDLMERLSISQPMLEAMLDDLGRLGYLRAVNSDCNEGHCSSCSVGRCSVSGPGRLWSLTERGAKAVAHVSP